MPGIPVPGGITAPPPHRPVGLDAGGRPARAVACEAIRNALIELGHETAGPESLGVGPNGAGVPLRPRTPLHRFVQAVHVLGWKQATRHPVYYRLGGAPSGEGHNRSPASLHLDGKKAEVLLTGKDKEVTVPVQRAPTVRCLPSPGTRCSCGQPRQRVLEGPGTDNPESSTRPVVCLDHQVNPFVGNHRRDDKVVALINAWPRRPEIGVHRGIHDIRVPTVEPPYSVAHVLADGHEQVDSPGGAPVPVTEGGQYQGLEHKAAQRVAPEVLLVRRARHTASG